MLPAMNGIKYLENDAERKKHNMEAGLKKII
jgi:hypothetical protein